MNSNWYNKIAHFDYNTSPNMGVRNTGVNDKPNIDPSDDDIKKLFQPKKKKNKRKLKIPHKLISIQNPSVSIPAVIGK